MKTRSCSTAVLEAAGSGLCGAPLGGAVERTGEGDFVSLSSFCSFTLSWLPSDGKSETAQTSSDCEDETSVVPAEQGIWEKVSGHVLDTESKSNMSSLFIFCSHPSSAALMELGAAPAQAVWPEAGIHSPCVLD